MSFVRAAWPGVAALAAAVAWLVSDLWTCFVPIDDAYISLRYARHLVEGNGLVYNVGERVEGFTNLAWTLLLAAGMAAGLDPIVFQHHLEAAAAVAVLVLAWIFACLAIGRDGEAGPSPAVSSLVAAFAPWMLVAGTSLADWSMSGLGEPLYVALVLATFLASASGSWAAAALGAAACILARPEGPVVAATAFGLRWIADPPERRRVSMAIVASIAALGALTAFRLAYYGSPVPNTFFAKVGGIPMSRGAAELVDFLEAGAALLVLPAAHLALRDRRWWGAAAYVAFTMAWVVRIGGDVFANQRFLLPALALLSVMTAVWMARCVARGAAGTGAAAVLAIVALVLAYAGVVAPFVPAGTPRWDTRAASLREGCVARVRMHDDLKARSERLEVALAGRSDAVVATPVIGATGWYFRGRILDILGITDAAIARHPNDLGGRPALPGHQRSHPDYVFEKAPDYIVISPVERPQNIPASVDIRHHRDFAVLYEWDPVVKAFRRRRDF